jgi:hypothetical protein
MALQEFTGLIVEDDGTKNYKVRELHSGDTRVVGAMAATLTGDPMVINAMASGDENQMFLAFATALLEKTPRELALWCASLVGEDRGEDVDEWLKNEREKALKETPPRVVTAGEARRKMEDAILVRMDSYPVGAYMDILTEVINKPSFEDFLDSCLGLTSAIREFSTRYRKQSKNGSKSRSKKS